MGQWKEPIQIHVILGAFKYHHTLHQATFQYHHINRFSCTHDMNLSQLNSKRHRQYINHFLHNHWTLTKHSYIPIPSLSSTHTNYNNHISNVKSSNCNTNHVYRNYHNNMYKGLIILLQICTIWSHHHTSHYHLYKLPYPHSQFRNLL